MINDKGGTTRPQNGSLQLNTKTQIRQYQEESNNVCHRPIFLKVVVDKVERLIALLKLSKNTVVYSGRVKSQRCRNSFIFWPKIGAGVSTGAGVGQAARGGGSKARWASPVPKKSVWVEVTPVFLGTSTPPPTSTLLWNFTSHLFNLIKWKTLISVGNFLQTHNQQWPIWHLQPWRKRDLYR